MTLSVIIPVLHESATINATVASVRRAVADCACEIIVVDGSATADTIGAITDHDVLTVRSAQGRARQMNAGAGVAAGSILWFVHADTHLPAFAGADVLAALGDQRNVGGAFRLRFGHQDERTRWLDVAWDAWANLTGCVYGDQAIFVRRDAFWALGGYRDIRIMEDLDLVGRLRKHGEFSVLEGRVETSARRFRRNGLSQVVRNGLIHMLFWAGVPPQRLASLYPARGPEAA